MSGLKDYVLSGLNNILPFMPRWVTRRSRSLASAKPLRPLDSREKIFFQKLEMGDPFSVTLVGGAPWGIRIAGGKDFNTPLIIRYSKLIKPNWALDWAKNFETGCDSKYQRAVVRTIFKRCTFFSENFFSYLTDAHFHKSGFLRISSIRNNRPFTKKFTEPFSL